ncbi:hypothetical protein F442_22350 [Phytophthora nicotianae P10297]|uniref:Uncharacterized protein n=1 Tax=Phytophthora nicotianae P10297 TaxID=1317064 RepID=W2Y0U0_PHYNI|nr:hypothetical protein F442_22350 [Phytophthora nicotianae P10297]
MAQASRSLSVSWLASTLRWELFRKVPFNTRYRFPLN